MGVARDCKRSADVAELSITVVPLGTDSLKSTPSRGDIDTLTTHGSLGLPESSFQKPSRSVQPFCRTHERDEQTGDRHTQTTTLLCV